jgi:hypothetical protein
MTNQQHAELMMFLANQTQLLATLVAVSTKDKEVVAAAQDIQKTTNEHMRVIANRLSELL